MKPNAPTHYVDTSVFIEALTSPMEDQGRVCSRYLARLGKIYGWIVAEPLLAEFYFFILKKQNKDTADELHDFFWFFFQDNQPLMISPEKGHDNADFIQNIDTRLGFMDSLHLANAMGNAQVFVTLDGKLLGNILLEQRLGLKILSPADLL